MGCEVLTGGWQCMVFRGGYVRPPNIYKAADVGQRLRRQRLRTAPRLGRWTSKSGEKENLDAISEFLTVAMGIVTGNTTSLLMKPRTGC